jgi:hypothetical protein
MAMLSAFTGAYRQERAAARPRPPRTPLLVRAGRLTARLLPRARALRTAALSLAGFGCLDFAAWQFNHIAGWAAIGISVLLLEYLTSDGGQ